MTDMVVLVDANDVQLGMMPKMEAHAKGVLHRAFSVFVFNSGGQMLLQRRAAGKYHSAGLWTNACCSHPSCSGDLARQAADRTVEEMGIEPQNLHAVGTLLYCSAMDNGLTENEFDHIFVGYSDALPTPDPREVSDYAYMTVEDIGRELRLRPQAFTVWFRKIMQRFAEVLETESGGRI